MATYSFEMITAAQAAAFSATLDTLTLDDPSETAGAERVVYDAVHSTITISSTVSGHAVTFGASIAGSTNFTFSDQSFLSIGGFGNDHIFGTPYGRLSALFGGPGDDTISASKGTETLSGGTGNDLFQEPAGSSPAVRSGLDAIIDWHVGDHIDFGGVAGSSSNYIELAEPNFSIAFSAALDEIDAGTIEYAAVQVGADVILIGDPYGFHAGALTAVTLSGRTLADVDFTSIVGKAPPTPPPIPVAGLILTGTAGDDHLQGSDNNDTISGGGGADSLSGGAGDDMVNGGDGADFLNGSIGADTLQGGAGSDIFFFQNDDSSAVDALGGHLERIDHIHDWSSGDFLEFYSGAPTATVIEKIVATSFDAAYNTAVVDLDTFYPQTGLNYTVAQVGSDVVVFALGSHNAVVLDNQTLANIGAENIGAEAPTSSPSAAGQIIVGAPGGDTIQAPDTNDTITSSSTASNYLRGNGGDDSIQGGSGFDDINGNKGNDSIDGGSGGHDWLVGGQGDDVIVAHQSDVVWGNLGNDTLHGGSTADQVRGGQGDDSIAGGSGDEFISGDRGADTESGGAGADVFHGSQDAGIDKVLDFNQAEGDRVMLDPGTHYTVSQVGADTVIDMGGGNQMILVGVQFSSLKDGWIFEG